jgi:hypothetical protein
MADNNKYRWQAWGTILIAVVVGLLCHCGLMVLQENSANKHSKNRQYHSRKNNSWNKRMVDSTTTLLKTGDIVVRRGDDMTSYMLSRLNTRDQTYSHCGVVAVEDEVAYIYHSIGGEDNPDGKIRRERASEWFSPANNIEYAVYRYPWNDSNIVKLVTAVKTYHKECRMFDMDFDLQTDDRMYCSEMIYKAAKEIVPEYIHTAERFGKTYIGVDNLYEHQHTVQICHIRFKW